MSGWTTVSRGNPYLQEAFRHSHELPAMMFRVTRSYFDGTDNRYLRMNRGDVVEVEPSEQDEVPEGWLFGWLNGLSGIFPADRVQPISGHQAGRPSHNESPKPRRKQNHGRQIPPDASPFSTDSIYELPADCSSLCVYKAVHKFEAKAEEELSIEVGDFIYVQPLSQGHVDSGWLRGFIGERKGLFPESFAVLHETDSDDDYIHMKEEEINPPFGMQKERVRPMRECIDTLIDVVDDSCAELEDTRDNFLVGRLSKVTSSQEDFKRVLDNWDSLIKHMKELLRTVRTNEKLARDDPSQWAVGDILNEKFSQAEKFTKCCFWRKDAEALLQKQSKHVIQKLFFKGSDKGEKAAEVDERELLTALQLPAKQIIKYPGLIKKVLETTPSDHADHEYIQDAFVKAKDICVLITKSNEDTKHNEEMTRIQEIFRGSNNDFLSDTDCLGPRKVTFTSKLQELRGGQKHDCVGFLLNDQLLLGYPKSAKIPDAYMTNAAKITFQASRPQPIYLNTLEVIFREVPDPTVFTILCYDDLEVTSLNLKAPSPRERKLWIQKIDEAAKLYSAAKRKRLYSRNQKDAISSQTTYLAKYNFSADYPEALSFTTGSIIKAGSRQEGANPGWMFGIFSNKSGWFPKALVELIPETEDSSTYIDQTIEVVDPQEVEHIPEWKPPLEPRSTSNQTYAMDQPQRQPFKKKSEPFGHEEPLPHYSEPQQKVKPIRAMSEEPVPTRHDIMVRSPRPLPDGPATLPRTMAKSSDPPQRNAAFRNFRDTPKLPPKKDRGKEADEVPRPPIQKKPNLILNQPKQPGHIADLQTALKARKQSGPPALPTQPHVPKPNKQWTPVAGMNPADLKLRKTSESAVGDDPRPLIPPRRGGPPR